MKLDQLSVRNFIQELSSGSPTPGGGSVAALCGAMGTALSAMVARLTVGREKFKDAWEEMEGIKQAAGQLAERFLSLVQEDTDAYQEVIGALGLPKQTEEEMELQQESIQKAMRKASSVPLETLRVSEKLIQMAKEAVKRGNPNTVTDGAAAVHLAHTAAVVAAYNVRINLSTLKDDDAFVEECKREVAEILERMAALLAEADGYVNANLP
ncbi:MAG: cyclodeaminase/cyclohydrolase family protein [Syntrophobacterales bacterium]|nr:MAG: cyclodeaminase/cyclohydrolase family protein [Syntrophobacterales bacterium]